ncbi:Flp family type IVb pilin [Arthrobacter sp. B2a2-09]|uniref:Flp family type IVb pilin n=1 Tax=Arthrobacter sp. B2a2-09 TaxID=2952822 RepID=UPI0022CD606D|nr:Flp family type IVb pilin [Arthrobacter sp. B2a2-09]MCZ9884240.1 Flp family type IVb pilin [Arthrobacter sp. B2a2-09]
MISSFLKSASQAQSDETGATAVEYGIMVSLIAVVIIVAVTLLGSTVRETFSQVQCSVSGKAWTAATTSGGTGTCA